VVVLDAGVDGPSEPLLGIAAGLDLVLISADEVLVEFGTRSYPSELIRDTDLNGILAAVVSRCLDGPVRASELVEDAAPEHRPAIQDVLDRFVQRGVLVDIEQTPTEQYLHYTLTGESNLTNKHVALVGAGPVGVRLAHGLLQHGLGQLRLLDDRRVDRTWLAYTAQTRQRDDPDQRSAAAALRDLLQRDAEGDRVALLDGGFDQAAVMDGLAGCDLAVLALEQPHPRLAHLVNRSGMRLRRPWLLVQLDGNTGTCGPLFWPPDTACYNDFATLADAATRVPQMARRYRRHLLERAVPSFFPGLPAHVDLVAGYAILAVVHFLLVGSCFALGRAVTIDFDRMLLDVQDILRLPRCPVCGHHRPAPRPPFSAEVVTRAATLAQTTD
jgi:bacteriocin biosynthesis cyclodehydratase domain-containing protein